MAITVKVTSAMVQQALRDTNWAAIDAQTDEESPAMSPMIRTRHRSSVRPRQLRPLRARCASDWASRAEFSARYHVPIGTLRDWEQNRKQPDAPALAYLRVIAREPGVVARALCHHDRRGIRRGC